MTTSEKSCRTFAACDRGVAAVEFALVAPLLFLLLAVSIELGRAYLAYRCFENTVVGVARQLASLPEYDTRARDRAKYIAAALLPPGGTANLNLQVTSLISDQGAMTQVFTNTLLGTDPKLVKSTAIAATEFHEGEYAIYLSASYQYRPMFDVLTASSFLMTKTFTINPYFSRAYVSNDDHAPDKYVN